MPARPKKTAVAAATKPDFAKLIGRARQQEREVRICLAGDLVADHAAAVADLELAKKASTDSLAGDGTEPIVERIRSLEAEMQANVYPFRVRALPPRTYRAFKAEHPIRIEEGGEQHAQDAVFGFNAETGFEPLTRMCLADPELDDAGFDELMESLNELQFEELAAACWIVNKGGLSVPFWSAASEQTESSAPE
jgi:hypothetical protein